MPKNIIIFSDGTGNGGGIYLDERRSNIYKLFRATRCGPDTDIDPKQQLAFYDPGVGTAPLKSGMFLRLYYRFMTFIGKATGLGITANVVDCYAALIRLWEPGDKVFLFGFSRGAYTVRLLGGVIAHCGIPQRTENGQRVTRDPKSSRRLARHAVTKIYQHMESIEKVEASKRDLEYLDQRRLLAKQFRKDYSANDGDNENRPNVAPHFIGVFDTVSSLFNPGFMALLAVMSIIALPLLASGVQWIANWAFGAAWTYWPVVGVLFVAALLVISALYLRSHLKFPGAIKKDREGWYSASETWRFSNWRMKFDDFDLSTRVVVARHALSIDERRKQFKRVPWTNDPDQDVSGKPDDWFQQVWFAGVHSDIGGSYADIEARLSDITLEWMVEAAETEDMKVDRRLLHLFPDSSGPQHDEWKASIFRHLGERKRPVPDDAPLHPSVIERFNAGPVLHYDETVKYRPEGLREHGLVKHLYD